MPKFHFDLEVYTSVIVDADSEEDARKILSQKLHGAEANLGAWDNGEPIIAEIGLYDDDDTIKLSEVEDGD